MITLRKELASLIVRHPTAELMFLVDNEERIDPDDCSHTQHRIEAIGYFPEIFFSEDETLLTPEIVWTGAK